MDGRLALTNATLSQSLLNRNKMTEMEQIDVSDNSDSVDSMQSTYSQQNHSEERSYLKRVNTISEVGDKSVKSPRLEPTKLVEMTQEVKEGVEENLASFDNMFSPEINDNYFGTDFNNDIDPFQDLPDPLESIKKEPVKEGEPVAIIPNKLSPYETCAQAIQILQPNLAANDVSKFTIQLKDTDKQNEIVTSVSKKQRPVDQNSQAFPLINQISNEMIISLPTHGQKELNLINISKVVKLKQVFPRILKKTSNSICRTRYLEELNDETVSKNMGTHFEHCERKANFHDRESQVEEEFFTEVKEQNMSMETLTNVMILRSPYLYTGLYGNVFSSFLNTLIQGCNESCRDVLMTLMKIRLDESFRTLEDLFCFHNGQASIMFKRIVINLASFLKKFFIPIENPDQKIRLIHRKIDSVIDYFYVRTHVSGDWRHENCESVKFLVSCTIDGVINFVSPWYPKNEKDLTVLRSSGYIKILEKGITVIANRKFIGIEKVLREKNCSLIEHSSAQCKFRTDTLASYKKKLRLIFDSLREFEYIGTKACIHKDDLLILNHILVITSAIVNS
ncbi:uncharacterized protein LOC117172804 isoform X2 [Belonocnema kinseyi]|nr:uncharacterized protein LOC117172804 isoform X2 [Belonocnema kinseyi]